MDKDKHYHEVVTGRQKFMLDLDGKKEHNTSFKKWNNIVTTISNTVKEMFDENDTPANVVICDSSSLKVKSTHIVVSNYMFPHYTNTRFIAAKVRHRLPEHMKKYIDMSIYRRKYNMRIEKSHKHGRYLVRQSTPGSIRETLLTDPHGTINMYVPVIIDSSYEIHDSNIITYGSIPLNTIIYGDIEIVNPLEDVTSNPVILNGF